MKTRIISGIILVLIALITIITGGPVLLLTLLFCSLVGMRELYSALGVVGQDGKIPPTAAVGYVAAAAYYAVLYFAGRACGPAAALGVCAVMTAYVLSFPSISADSAIGAAFGFIYVPVMLGFVYLLRAGERGMTTVWLVFLSSWVADTCAYFTGMLLGKHKMSPILSPKKTVEGAIGGIAGSALAGILFSVLFENGSLMWQYALICGAGAVISIFGDLTASAIKRDRKIKDYGNLIPGHGGIMDRFDSVIFTAPVIYFLTLFLV